MPAITEELRQLPAALQTFAPTRCASGATPGSCRLPAPSPAMIPDTCVPCPLSSTPGVGTQLPTSSDTTEGTTVMQFTNESTLPVRSEWFSSMPLSITPTVTPVPVTPFAHAVSAPMSCVPRFVWSAKSAAAAGATDAVSSCSTLSATSRVTCGTAATRATFFPDDDSATQPIRSKR